MKIKGGLLWSLSILSLSLSALAQSPGASERRASIGAGIDELNLNTFVLDRAKVDLDLPFGSSFDLDLYGGPAWGHYLSSVGVFLPYSEIINGNTYIFSQGSQLNAPVTETMRGFDVGLEARWYLP